MKVQIIKSTDGKPEYVLLPIAVYAILRQEIDKECARLQEGDDYVLFDAADYIDNPVALMRIKAHITQEALAKLMAVSQAYISKIEMQKRVSLKTLNKVKMALKKYNATA